MLVCLGTLTWNFKTKLIVFLNYYLRLLKTWVVAVTILSSFSVNLLLVLSERIVASFRAMSLVDSTPLEGLTS